MKVFFLKKLLILLCPIFCLCSLSACRDEVRYVDYVSELRNNVFLAETEDYSLRIFSIKKENPYEMDGIPKQTSILTEVYFTAPKGDLDCSLSFTVQNRQFGGDMSYDNVKAEYYYSCTLDSSKAKEIPCKLVYGDEEIAFTAKSVLEETTLSPEQILKMLKESENELFTALTDKYGFQGEIYVRLLFEDSAYYYVGIIDRNKNVSAFLLNAKTGKILAKRQS